MLSKEPEERPTIDDIERNVKSWKSNVVSKSNVSLSDLFAALARILARISFEYLVQYLSPSPIQYKIITDQKREKIVSKNRPNKIQKDHKILQ